VINKDSGDARGFGMGDSSGVMREKQGVRRTEMPQRGSGTEPGWGLGQSPLKFTRIIAIITLKFAKTGFSAMA